MAGCARLSISLEDINAAFAWFQYCSKMLSGTSTAETAGALLQVNASIRLWQCCEAKNLSSVLEQAPGLVVALTKN
jgi:hypothetical protein